MLCSGSSLPVPEGSAIHICLLFICPEVNSRIQSLSLCYLSTFPPLVQHLGIFKIREHFPIDVQNIQNFLNCCHCLYFTLGIQISLNMGEGNVKMREKSISVKFHCDNSLGNSQSINQSINSSCKTPEGQVLRFWVLEPFLF